MSKKIANTSIPPFPSNLTKRELSIKVETLLDKGNEALQAGGDRGRIIKRWRSKEEMLTDADKLLEKTTNKELKWKQEYNDDKTRLDEKFKKTQTF